MTLRSDISRARRGQLVHVEVIMDESVADLRGYQLHLAPSGGKRGQLELVDISIEMRDDQAFEAEWQAFNQSRGQMVAGRDGAGHATPGGYLATFTYRVSRDAAGTFVVDLLHDDRDPVQRTFVFPTPARAKIEVADVTPAIIHVGNEGIRRTR